jgi:hypothetical protein
MADRRNDPDCAPHAYDAPGLSPKDFLLAVMRDRTAPLGARIEAASKALALSPRTDIAPPYDPDFGCTYKISSLLQ